MDPQARIEALKNAPLNGWAAFTGDEERLLGYGHSYDEVVDLAEKLGITDPVVVKIPENWNARILSA